MKRRRNAIPKNHSNEQVREENENENYIFQRPFWGVFFRTNTQIIAYRS